MKARALIELTVDLSQPAAELAAVIGAVLSAVPQAHRESVLRSLDEEIALALVQYETKQEAAA